MKADHIIISLLILICIFDSTLQIRLRRAKKKGKKSSGHNIGTNLYSSQVTTKSMKRPIFWYFNVMLEKPSENDAQNAEYNGLRYQTDELMDNLEREYQGYVRDNFDDILTLDEQKLLGATKAAALKSVDAIPNTPKKAGKKCGS